MEAFGVGQHVSQLAACSRLGNADDYVLSADHPQIPVAGFGGMDEEGGRTGGGEGGDDFTGDVPGLAHAGADDPSLGGGEQIHRGDETRA